MPLPPLGNVVDVQATDSKNFVPSNLSISVGDTVRWTNTGSKVHNLTFAESVLPSTTVAGLAAGVTHQMTFNRAGTFSYQCTLHDGMVGSITVQAASGTAPAPTPAPAPAPKSTLTPTPLSPGRMSPT